MCRIVTLPEDNVQLRLYLHSMPGRDEAWGDFIAGANRHRIDVIVCLVSDDEIEQKSPYYAKAIKNGTLSYTRRSFPIPDYGVPQDREKYVEAIRSISELLRSGHTILVHCGAGYGRTGTFAICLLLALGINRRGAEKAINDAGSSPETDEQRDLVDWCEKEFLVVL